MRESGVELAVVNREQAAARGDGQQFAQITRYAVAAAISLEVFEDKYGVETGECCARGGVVRAPHWIRRDAAEDLGVVVSVLDPYRRRHEALRRVFGVMVANVIETSRAGLAEAAPRSPQEVRELGRAVMEGTAFSLRHCVEAEGGLPSEPVQLTGGGATGCGGRMPDRKASASSRTVRSSASIRLFW